MRGVIYVIVVALIGVTVLSTGTLAGQPVGIDEVGRLDIEADKIVTQGDLAYALDDGCEQVQATPPEYECTGRLNVLVTERGQTTPIVIGEFELPDTAFVDLAVQGEYANIVTQTEPRYGTTADYGLTVVRASASGIRQVGSIQLPIPLASSFSMEVFSDNLYLASSRGGLYVYNVADPSEPAEVAQILQDTEIYDLALQRDNLFVAGPGGLRILDVANRQRQRPEPIAEVPGVFLGVEVVGDLAFAHEVYLCFTPDSPQPVECGEILVEFDVSDPTNPIRRGSVFGGEGVNIRAVDRAGNYLLVAENKSVRVFDLETSDRPPVTAYQPRFDQQFGSPLDIDVTNGLIYVAAQLGTEAASVRLVRIAPRWITYLPFIRRSESNQR